MGGGWRRPPPIKGATAPPQRSPPRASRLGGGGDRRRRASSAPRAATAWGLQLPTGPAAGPGSEKGRRARPENQPTPGALLRVPSDFHGDSRHFTKPGRLNALMHGSPGTATASPPPRRTPPERLEQCPRRLSPAAGCCRACPSLQAGLRPPDYRQDPVLSWAPGRIVGWRGWDVVIGKCSHIQRDRPRGVTSVRICPFWDLEPGVHVLGCHFSIQGSQVQAARPISETSYQGMVNEAFENVL